MRPLKPCRQVGCSQLVQPPERYCALHKWTPEQRAAYERERNRERHRRYDREQRDQRSKAFYSSPDWERLRVFVLERDQHLCQECLKEHRMTPADTVDHIIPIRVDWSRRLDPNNCRALCASCHSRRHWQEQLGQRNGETGGVELPPGVAKFLGDP